VETHKIPLSPTRSFPAVMPVQTTVATLPVSATQRETEELRRQFDETRNQMTVAHAAEVERLKAELAAVRADLQQTFRKTTRGNGEGAGAVAKPSGHSSGRSSAVDAEMTALRVDLEAAQLKATRVADVVREKQNLLSEVASLREKLEMT